MSKFTNDGLTGHRMLYSCGNSGRRRVKGGKRLVRCVDMQRERSPIIIRRRYTKKLEGQKKIYHRNEQLDDTSVDRKHLDGLYSSIRPRSTKCPVWSALHMYMLQRNDVGNYTRSIELPLEELLVTFACPRKPLFCTCAIPTFQSAFCFIPL